MKLITEPLRETEYIDVPIYHGAVPMRVAGRGTVTPVIIHAPPLTNEKDRAWHLLKFGKIIDFYIGTKIDEIKFDDFILYGVTPTDYDYHTDYFECTVDHFLHRTEL